MPPKRKRPPARSKRAYEVDDCTGFYDQIIDIPNPDDSGSSDESGDEEEDIDLWQDSYRTVSKSYGDNQTKLEGDHIYLWKDGEKKYKTSVSNTSFLTNSQKNQIRKMTPVELFEKFFSDDMKTYIQEATHENGYDLSKCDLETFLGIIILGSFNRRKSQRDYWSSDPLVSCEIVQSAMSRNKFEQIKSSLKCSKPGDQNPEDKGWRVRVLLNKFRSNIQQFGYFGSALSIDEMMAKSYARTSLKQFIRGKPIRFGLKFWGLCTSEGFLLDLDLYCGKGSEVTLLNKCALGTKVVMNLLHPFLKKVPGTEIAKYHVYFDNFFTSLDLVLHLHKLGLKCTGTIRENRVPVKNNIDKKAPRGTCVVKHDENSGINFISIMDSKQVSIVSSAAGISPQLTSTRYSAENKAKIEYSFPQAFHIYNKYMGGVDLHDNHCNNVLSCIRSKKWTWVVFMRFIQAAITNGLLIHNMAISEEKKWALRNSQWISRDNTSKMEHGIGQNPIRFRTRSV